MCVPEALLDVSGLWPSLWWNMGQLRSSCRGNLGFLVSKDPRDLSWILQLADQRELPGVEELLRHLSIELLLLLDHRAQTSSALDCAVYVLGPELMLGQDLPLLFELLKLVGLIEAEDLVDWQELGLLLAWRIAKHLDALFLEHQGVSAVELLDQPGVLALWLGQSSLRRY